MELEIGVIFLRSGDFLKHMDVNIRFSTKGDQVCAKTSDIMRGEDMVGVAGSPGFGWPRVGVHSLIRSDLPGVMEVEIRHTVRIPFMV